MLKPEQKEVVAYVLANWQTAELEAWRSGAAEPDVVAVTMMALLVAYVEEFCIDEDGRVEFDLLSYPRKTMVLCELLRRGADGSASDLKADIDAALNEILGESPGAPDA